MNIENDMVGAENDMLKKIVECKEMDLLDLGRHYREALAEITRLKALNREMVKLLKDISVGRGEGYCEIPGYQQEKIIELLAKAGGEGE